MSVVSWDSPFPCFGTSPVVVSWADLYLFGANNLLCPVASLRLYVVSPAVTALFLVVNNLSFFLSLICSLLFLITPLHTHIHTHTTTPPPSMNFKQCLFAYFPKGIYFSVGILNSSEPKTGSPVGIHLDSVSPGKGFFYSQRVLQILVDTNRQTWNVFFFFPLCFSTPLSISYFTCSHVVVVQLTLLIEVKPQAFI